MIYVEDHANGNLLINDIDEGEEMLTANPLDYIGMEYTFEESRLKVKVYPRIPKKSLSSTFKGTTGEELGTIYLNLKRDDIDNIYTIANCTYDIQSDLPIKYDVKTGFEKKNRRGKATHFKHHLTTNKPGENYIQISSKRWKKNYELEGIHFLMCIDFFDDPNVIPNIYMIPTSIEAVRGTQRVIQIPSSGRGVYAMYRLDLCDVIIPKELPNEVSHEDIEEE